MLVAVLLFERAWRHPLDSNIGDFGDQQQTMWFLRWMPYAIAHHVNPLFTHAVNVPDGINLMWNTSVPLPALLLTPVTLTAGPVAAYNVLVTLGLALSAWTAFLAIRRHASHPAAALGGLLYGFSPYMVAQAVGHANLTLAIVPPLVLMVLEDLLTSDGITARRCGVLLGVLAAAQLLIAEELLASMAAVAVVGVALLAVLHRERVRERARRVATGIAWGLAVFAVLAALPLAVQFAGPQRVHGPAQKNDVFVTDAANLVVPTAVQAVDPSTAQDITLRYPGTNVAEEDGYVGIALLAIIAMLVVRWWRARLVRYYALFFGAVVLLSLGPRLHVAGEVTAIRLPWRIIGSVPVLENLLPGRLMLYAFFAAGMLLAVFVDDLRTLGMRSLRFAAGACAVLLAVALLMPRWPFRSNPDPVPEFFTSAAAVQLPEDSTVLLVPFPGLYSVPPMLWQAEAGMRFRAPGGYFSRPDDQGHPFNELDTSTTAHILESIRTGSAAPELDSALRATIASDLRRWGVSTVVLGPMDFREPMRAFLTQYLLRPPDRATGGVEIWTGVGG